MHTDETETQNQNNTVGAGNQPRRRRNATRLSRVDTQAIRNGGKAAWDAIRPFVPSTRPAEEPTGETVRDRQMRADRPPHW